MRLAKTMQTGRTIHLICDAQGQLHPLPDALRNLPQHDAATLYDLVDASSHDGAETFVQRLYDGGFLCDVRLNVVNIADTPTTFNFAGGRISDDRYLVVGTDSPDPFIPFYEALAHVDGEQIQTLRAALRGEGIQRRVDQRDPLFDAMSALNNEMATLQRALAKSNVEIKAQRDRFHITLASIRDAVIATDDAGQITFMNQVAEDLTQWTMDEARGVPIHEVFHCVEPLERTLISLDVMERLDRREIVTLPETMLLQGKHGREIAVEDSVAGIYHQNGKLLGMVLVFRDVSGRWQMEQERASLLEQEQNARLSAESALEMRRKFVAMMTHELRSPLAAIKGFVTSLLLPDHPWDEADELDFLETINQEADKLDRLIGEILDFSRMQSTQFQLNRTGESLDEALRSAMPQITVMAHNHQLEIDFPADLPDVRLDVFRIAQVLVNLVGNAAKYAPAGTRIEMVAREENGSICVDVRDEGKGIPLHERDAIFDAFHQVSAAGKPKGGVGLGLAICKGIVEAHSGRIWAEDNQPKGMVFRFTLPLGSAPHGDA